MTVGEKKPISQKKRHIFWMVLAFIVLGLALVLLVQPTVFASLSPVESTAIPTVSPLTPSPTSEPSPTIAPSATPSPTPMPTMPPTPTPCPEKMAYLTFDDGPSELTEQVTALLAKYDIKATFFVLNRTDERSKQIVKHTSELGHSIQMHCGIHDYRSLYASPESFMQYVEDNYWYIAGITGIPPSLVRLPGGSVNESNAAIRTEILKRIEDLGFVYFDWNCSSGDGNPKPYEPDAILENVLRTAGSKNRIVVIMHDTGSKTTTVQALPQVIEALRDRGYSFGKLAKDVPPVQQTRP